MPESFPQRHGLAGPPPGTLLRDEVPPSFRIYLLDLGHDGHFEYHELQKVVCAVLQEWPSEAEPPYFNCKQHFKTCEWFRIFEIVEGVHALISERPSVYRHMDAYRFAEAVNKGAVQHNIGWQVDDEGKVVVRGEEVFEATVQSAGARLIEGGKPTAARHLKEALRALSVKPAPNTSGAVSHATNAVECVLGEVTGEKMTLGKYLDRHPHLFRPQLKKALDGLYGYASDEGARHGREGVEPGFPEAEFAVATCAAVCRLLMSRGPE